MTFINTEGLAIFGPGSEWLWTMAQFLALAITGLAIFRQLQAQRSAQKVNTLVGLVQQYDSERMVRHRLAVLMHVAEGKPDWPPALYQVGMFFNGLAQHERQGDLRIDVLTEWSWGWVVQVWWARCASYVLDEAAEDGPPGLGAMEALAVATAAIDRRRGRPALDPDTVRAMG